MLGVDCPSNTWFCVQQHLGLQGILNVLALSANSTQYLAGRIENLVFSHPATWKTTRHNYRRADLTFSQTSTTPTPTYQPPNSQTRSDTNTVAKPLYPVPQPETTATSRIVQCSSRPPFHQVTHKPDGLPTSADKRPHPRQGFQKNDGRKRIILVEDFVIASHALSFLGLLFRRLVASPYDQEKSMQQAQLGPRVGNDRCTRQIMDCAILRSNVSFGFGGRLLACLPVPGATA
jgi:hypothetical protein